MDPAGSTLSVSDAGRARLAALEQWWAAHACTPGRPDEVPKVVDAALRDGLLDLPQPGAGRTGDRFAALAWWGAAELSVARLVEGHTDAVAIHAELGIEPPGPGRLSAVWAAEPPGAGVVARKTPAGWLLDGPKVWCSGASRCDEAVLTTTAPDGSRLFTVDLGHTGVSRPAPRWHGPGMAASDTEAVAFTAVPATPVGGPAAYLDRPGFWAGGIGVAAVWWGGALAAAAPLRRAATQGRAGPHTLAHLGRVRVLLTSTAAVLRDAARALDAQPDAQQEALALTVRSAVADAASEILDRVGRALGPGPLATDAAHAQRVADLTVYLRQHHAERDLARLGELENQSPW